MQGCTTCMQPSLGCVDLAKDNASLLQGCNNMLESCYKLEIWHNILMMLKIFNACF